MAVECFYEGCEERISSLRRVQLAMNKDGHHTQKVLWRLQGSRQRVRENKPLDDPDLLQTLVDEASKRDAYELEQHQRGRRGPLDVQGLLNWLIREGQDHVDFWHGRVHGAIPDDYNAQVMKEDWIEWERIGTAVNRAVGLPREGESVSLPPEARQKIVNRMKDL